MFEQEVQKLAEVKDVILQVVQATPTPTVQNTARQAVDHLDTCYLFMGQLSQVVNMANDPEVQAKIQEAMQNQGLKVVDGEKGDA